MDLEVAILFAKNGDTDAFLKAMAEVGTPNLLACEGCRSVKVLPGVENPGKVLILVEWDSIDAHGAAKTSDAFGRFVQGMGPFFGEGGGSMEHFRAG